MLKNSLKEVDFSDRCCKLWIMCVCIYIYTHTLSFLHVRLVKAMVFPVVMYGCESWTTWKTERRRIDALEPWCWRRFLRVPWTARRSNQSILKEVSPEYSLEGLILMLKLQYLGHWYEELTHWIRPWCWERLKVGGEGDNRGWDGWMTSPMDMTLSKLRGVGDVQGSLVCCSPWGYKELDTTEWLNWTEIDTPTVSIVQ